LPALARQGAVAPGALGRLGRFRAEFDPAEAWSGEGHDPHSDVFPGRDLGHPADEAFVKGAHDRPVGIVGINAERAVLEIDGQDPIPPDWSGGREGKVLQGVDHLPRRLLEGRVVEGLPECPTSLKALLLGGAGRFPAVCLPEQPDETPYEQAGLRIIADNGNPQPIMLGRPAPAPRNSGVLDHHSGGQEFLEMALHRRPVDAHEPAEFRNPTRSFGQGFHDGQSRVVGQEVVALGSDGARKTSIHLYEDPDRGDIISWIMSRRSASKTPQFPIFPFRPSGSGRFPQDFPPVASPRR
jgi:hypothetical protein